jgi:hypothetical protein
MKFSEMGGFVEPFGRYAIEGETRWSLTYPSIGWSPEDGYRVVYHSTNHYLLTDGSTMLTHGEFLQRRTYMQELSHNLEKLENPHKLLASSYRTSQGPVPIVKGVKKARLFWRPEGWHLLANLDERGPVVGVAVGLDSAEVYLAALPALRGVEGRDWIPVAYGGSENFDFILPRGKVVYQRKPVRVQAEVPELRHFFGGPPVVPLDDGTFLGVPHMVEQEGVRVYTARRMAYVNGTQDRYTHRFVRYSDGGAAVEMSDPFVFESWGIEQCAGLVHWGDDFVLTWGRNEVASMLGKIDQRKVLKLLKKVG